MMISPSVTKAASAPEPATSAPEPARQHNRSLLLGLLPFIGVILFAVSAAQIVTGGRPADWQHQLALAAVVYLVGAGCRDLSHLLRKGDFPVDRIRPEPLRARSGLR
jgi:hypothetical protein